MEKLAEHYPNFCACFNKHLGLYVKLMTDLTFVYNFIPKCIF